MSQVKLLIVDDEPTIVRYIQKIYQRKGFITFGATDGIVAVEIFKKERPHLNLIDIHMPLSPIDGVEVLKRIKELDKDANCIMVTRLIDQDKVKQARNLGASAYLLKPLELKVLNKAITDITKKIL